MFGTKARREERERQIAKRVRKQIREEAEQEASQRPDLIEAVREVLSSTNTLLLRAPAKDFLVGLDNIEVHGNSQNGCTISFVTRDRSYYAAPKGNVADYVMTTRSDLKKAFGKTYNYTLWVTAMCPSAATQLRSALGDYSRSYADEYKRVSHDFKSNKELKQWLADGGSRLSKHTYRISMRARSV